VGVWLWRISGGTVHMMKFTHDTRTHARGKIDFLLILYIFNHKERKENSLLGQPKPIIWGYKRGYIWSTHFAIPALARDKISNVADSPSATLLFLPISYYPVIKQLYTGVECSICVSRRFPLFSCFLCFLVVKLVVSDFILVVNNKKYPIGNC